VVKTQQASFLSFAVETCGGLGKSARKLMKLIALAAENQQQMLNEREVRKELGGSAAINGNAMILLPE